MAAVHSFRLRNGDREMEEILAGMAGREKSDFIRNALYFYIKYEHRIKQLDEICSGVREILKRNCLIYRMIFKSRYCLVECVIRIRNDIVRKVPGYIGRFPAKLITVINKFITHYRRNPDNFIE